MPSRVVITATLARQVHPAALLWKGSVVKEPRATLEGKPLPTPSVMPLGDDAQLIVVTDAAAEGQLEVSFDL